MPEPPSVLNIHTPTSSFAIVHSLSQETLYDLFNKLSRKPNTDYYGERVGPGWLKYEYNDAIWNLDDESDYTISVWRRQQQVPASSSSDDGRTNPPSSQPFASSSKSTLSPPTFVGKMSATPTLHLHNPKAPLPSPGEYCNPAYYVFANASRSANALASVTGAASLRGKSPVPSKSSTRRGKKGTRLGEGTVVDSDEDEDDGIPKFKKQFDRFHAENGVRTVMGSIGPVKNVRMLLKNGYRHVYISRKFAIKHGFIPADAAPGNYGYGGLVNIGSWPITLVPSSSQPNRVKPAYQTRQPDAFQNQKSVNGHRRSSSLPNGSPTRNGNASAATRSKKTTKTTVEPAKTVTVDVYLSEEPHFDCVLGRSFFEKRQVKISSIDPTDVVCLDTGEKIECELVILKDGRGEIVTVT